MLPTILIPSFPGASLLLPCPTRLGSFVLPELVAELVAFVSELRLLGVRFVVPVARLGRRLRALGIQLRGPLPLRQTRLRVVVILRALRIRELLGLNRRAERRGKMWERVIQCELGTSPVI